MYTLLSNPIRRWQFLVGKFVGLLAVLAVNLIAMSVALFVVLWLYGGNPLPLLPAILMIYLELVVITAFALLFSSLTNPVLSVIWTIAVYVAGHLAWSLRLLQERVTGEIARGACEAAYWALPNLSRLDLKREAVHGLPIDGVSLAWGVSYGVAYALVVLSVACWVFERKDFS